MDKGIGKAYRAAFAIGTRRPTRYPCRCVKCGRRHTLRMQPDEYSREPKCKSRCTGGRLRVDWYRMAAEWGAKPCRCGEYSFPHASGRGFCEHNQAVTLEDRRERWENRKWA